MKQNRKVMIKPSEPVVVESVETELYEAVRSISSVARAKVYSVANAVTVETCWNVGREIVEKQGRTSRAKYGDGLIKSISLKFGSGFTVANLRNMRRFFVFPKRYTVCSELSRSHYREKELE